MLSGSREGDAIVEDLRTLESGLLTESPVGPEEAPLHTLQQNSAQHVTWSRQTTSSYQHTLNVYDNHQMPVSDRSASQIGLSDMSACQTNRAVLC